MFFHLQSYHKVRTTMDSDDDYLYDATDSGNESPEEEGEEEEDMQDEVDDFGIDMDPEPGGSHAQKIEDEYPFEVLSTEKIVSNMVESIKEVSAVVQDQIPTTTVGIILFQNAFLATMPQIPPGANPAEPFQVGQGASDGAAVQ